jgi:hypothetical protein
MSNICITSSKPYDTEASLLKDVLSWISTQPDIWPVRVVDDFHVGYSDLLLCVNGWFIGCELKDRTGTPTVHQLDFIKYVKRCGGLGGVCRTLQEVWLLIEEGRRLAGYAKKYRKDDNQ